MTSRTILVLAISAAFVTGTITTGTDAFAKDKPNGGPFQALWVAIDELTNVVGNITEQTDRTKSNLNENFTRIVTLEDRVQLLESYHS